MRTEDSMKLIDPVIAKPRDAGLLLIWLKAWAVSSPPESEIALREQLTPNSTRAVWSLGGGRRDARLALTVKEHGSVRDALRALAGELEANQLATVPQGPSDLGEISFVHPPDVVPAVFFVTGNLMLGVFSFGREYVDVVPFARRVDAEVRTRPAETRDGGIDVRSDARGILALPRFAAPDGYLRVLAPGSDLRKEDSTIVGATGDVDVFYIELGREAFSVRVRR
jgi:hypothetical protein